VGLQKAYNRNERRITYGHSLGVVASVIIIGVLRAKNQMCRQRHLWGYRSRNWTL